MVCLSHSGTIKLVEKISEDYDINVQYWSHDLLNNLKKRQSQLACFTSNSYIERFTEEDEDDDGLYQSTFDYTLSEDITVADEKEKDEDDKEEDDNDDFTEVDDVGLLQLMDENNWSIDDGNNEADNAEMSDVTEWKGFKIVGDNLDKNFRRTYQRIDSQTQSRHYFHSFAVLDRVDLSHYSDLPPSGEINIPQILPSKEDELEIKAIFMTLISRVLVKHFDEFQNEKQSVVWHIPHEFSKEMCQRSVVVPLGVDLKNENKLDEMCEIMDRLHKYVPTIRSEECIVLPDGSEIQTIKTDVWETLFGGDQLTVARARGARSIRGNHHTSEEQLGGLFPVIEDWHTRMTLMKVIWIRLFTKKSSCDKGTLFQLKNLIHRTSVPGDPEDNMQAAEDFLELILEAHIVTAAKTLYVSDITVVELAEKIVDNYVQVSHRNTLIKDQVHMYACEVLSLALLWQSYYDATKEGDGRRILKLWKYLLLVFKKANRRNYAKEVAITLVQFMFLTSERKAAQMMTTRFVNTKGRAGCNMPCDLHMEHYNRRLKGIIRHLHSNIQPHSIVKAARSIGVVNDVCSLFESKTTGKADSGQHQKPGFSKDSSHILDELVINKVFQVIEGRRHSTLSIKQCLLEDVDREEIETWILEKILPGLLYQ
jgi:L1 cell adhesion molecule like protein